MSRNKKKTVTTVEITLETESRLYIRRQVVRSGADHDTLDPQTDKPLPRLIDVAAKLLRGEDDEN